MKIAWMGYGKANNHVFPTEDELIDVAMSNIDMTNEKQVQVALWVWEFLYPHCLGKTSIYSIKTNMLTTIPMDVKLEVNPQYPAFSHVNRAFMVALCENNRDKWTAVCRLGNGRTDFIKFVPKRPTKTQLKNGEVAADGTVVKTKEEFAADLVYHDA